MKKLYTIVALALISMSGDVSAMKKVDTDTDADVEKLGKNEEVLKLLNPMLEEVKQEEIKDTKGLLSWLNSESFSEALSYFSVNSVHDEGVENSSNVVCLLLWRNNWLELNYKKVIDRREQVLQIDYAGIIERVKEKYGKTIVYTGVEENLKDQIKKEKKYFEKNPNA